MRTVRKEAEQSLGFHPLRTPRGWLGLVFRGDRLARVFLPYPSRKSLMQSLRRELGWVPETAVPRAQGRMVRTLERYLAGRRVDPAAVDTPLDLEGVTSFRQRVYRALRQVPRGHVVTYGALAQMAGSARAARGVGGAMAANHLPLVIPCHRVVGAARQLGGFSAAGGVETKRALLQLEGWDGERFHYTV